MLHSVLQDPFGKDQVYPLRHADPQLRPVPVFHLRHFPFQPVKIRHQGSGLWVEIRPCGRQLRAGLPPNEQLDAQVVLQLRDGLAHCLAGDVQLFGRTQKAVGSGHRQKSSELFDLHMAASFPICLSIFLYTTDYSTVFR